MAIGKIFDDLKALEYSYNFIYNAYQSFRGFKLVIFGTTGVGKTTMWEYLKTENMVDSTKIDKTLGINEMDKFRVKSVKLSFIPVGIRATDLPGDKDLRHTWKQVLESVKPDGVIFLLDHIQDPNIEVPEEGYDPERLAEHKEAFDHLMDLILNNREISENLQALAIGVNKTDILRKDISYGRILDKSGINTYFRHLNELENCRSTAFGISALTGGNVIEMMRWLVSSFSRG